MFKTIKPLNRSNTTKFPRTIFEDEIGEQVPDEQHPDKAGSSLAKKVMS
jgi:hypothetical protein